MEGPIGQDTGNRAQVRRTRERSDNRLKPVFFSSLNFSRRTTDAYDLGRSGRVLKMALKGPFNPLEFKLQCAHKMGGLMDAHVDPESVNSVLLDRFPNDEYDQWLVAAHVGMSSHASSALTLRSTTFMPNLPGLGALLTAVFAPFVEMRCDTRAKKYTGLLAGLGWRETDWGLSARAGGVDGVRKKPSHCSYWSQHDLEVSENKNKKIFYGRIDLSNIRPKTNLARHKKMEPFPPKLATLIRCTIEKQVTRRDTQGSAVVTRARRWRQCEFFRVDVLY
jgi:hypothetical protein